MKSAGDLVNLLAKSNHLEDFLLRDMRTTGETGFVLGETGNSYERRSGDVTSVSLNVEVGDDDEQVIPVHTHPSTTDATPSGEDITRSVNDDRILGIIVLSQEMFETDWRGHAVLFGDGNVVDETEFVIECDGSTDGPAAERHLSNPQIKFR